MNIIWLLVFICLLQSAIFAGLTIGLFGLSRLRLEIEAESNNKYAERILDIRKDSNFLLATLLWGNVAVNVLIALLTDSIMSGTAAFLFSTVGITIFGEIMPQAYFSRHALRISVHLIPMIRLYQILLYPVAKPSAMLLDWWLGKEELQLFKERSLMVMLEKHMGSTGTEINRTEGTGALNFLMMDDVRIVDEGSILDPQSIIKLHFKGDKPCFPEFRRDPSDPFLQQVQSSGKKWVVLIDEFDRPRIAIDADGFLRSALFEGRLFEPLEYCHPPTIIASPDTKLENVIRRLKVYPLHEEDDVIDLDLVIYWVEGEKNKRIITGSDILGRLLRGIAVRVDNIDTKDDTKK